MIALLALLTGEPVVLAAPFVAAAAVASSDNGFRIWSPRPARAHVIVNGQIVPAGTSTEESRLPGKPQH